MINILASYSDICSWTLVIPRSSQFSPRGFRSRKVFTCQNRYFQWQISEHIFGFRTLSRLETQSFTEGLTLLVKGLNAAVLRRLYYNMLYKRVSWREAGVRDNVERWLFTVVAWLKFNRRCFSETSWIRLVMSAFSHAFFLKHRERQPSIDSMFEVQNVNKQPTYVLRCPNNYWHYSIALVEFEWLTIFIRPFRVFVRKAL